MHSVGNTITIQRLGLTLRLLHCNLHLILLYLVYFLIIYEYKKYLQTKNIFILIVIYIVEIKSLIARGGFDKSHIIIHLKRRQENNYIHVFQSFLFYSCNLNNSLGMATKTLTIKIFIYRDDGRFWVYYRVW